MQKSLLATPLQPAIETSVKKIAVAAPKQPATETVETAVKHIEMTLLAAAVLSEAH